MGAMGIFAGQLLGYSFTYSSFAWISRFSILIDASGKMRSLQIGHSLSLKAQVRYA
jgi:hypothetical protein